MLNKLTVCGNPSLSKYWHHFPNSNCSLSVPVSHLVNYSRIQNFLIISIVLFMVICDLCFLRLLLWFGGAHKLHPYKMANLIINVYVLTASTPAIPPITLTLLAPPQNSEDVQRD